MAKAGAEDYVASANDIQQVEFDGSETIKSLSLYGNGEGTRTGRLTLTTSKNKDFDTGSNKAQEYAIDHASGILVGFGGSAGEDINNMGPVFIKPYSKA